MIAAALIEGPALAMPCAFAVRWSMTVALNAATLTIVKEKITHFERIVDPSRLDQLRDVPT
jgi:hypothetical protein